MAKDTENCIFFWGHQGTGVTSMLSNFHPTPFEIDFSTQDFLNLDDVIKFNCGEQAMHYMKAIFFNDKAIASQIMKTSDPKKQKALGREVHNFNRVDWEEVREKVMHLVVHNKINQTPELKTYVDDAIAAGKEFVEASPCDDIWGIRCDARKAAAGRKFWKGLNLLGKAINNYK